MLFGKFLTIFLHKNGWTLQLQLFVLTRSEIILTKIMSIATSEKIPEHFNATRYGTVFIICNLRVKPPFKPLEV